MLFGAVVRMVRKKRPKTSLSRRLTRDALTLPLSDVDVSGGGPSKNSTTAGTFCLRYNARFLSLVA